MGIPNIFANRKENDLFNACSFLLHGLKARFTRTGLSDSLENHVEYSSILCLKDTLSLYGIESAAIRKGEYSYSDFETPFICSIQREGWPQPRFTVITKAEKPLLELEHIIKSNHDVRIHIIFTTSDEEGDIKTPPVPTFWSYSKSLRRKRYTPPWMTGTWPRAKITRPLPKNIQ